MLLCALVVAGGCESINRAIFRFNEGMDRYVIGPTVDVYEFILPALVRKGISNVFATIGTASTLANDLLQGKFTDAGEDTGRLLANLVLGVGGVFDVATAMGIPQNEEDFGQTLGVWGIGPGPYIVLPLFGPSTARDAWDLPFSIVTGPAFYINNTAARVSLFVVGGINDRSEADPLIRRRDESAVDRYTFTREAYLQRRQFLVRDGRMPDEQVDDALDLDDVLDLPDDDAMFEPDPEPPPDRDEDGRRPPGG